MLLIQFIINSYSNQHILVTGGCGYIGSHTVVELLNLGYEVSIIDNLSNSKLSVLDRIELITGRKPTFYQVDCTNQKALQAVFQKGSFDAVIHMAGYKSVSESIINPVKYYDNNVVSTLRLIKEMSKNHVRKLIFSSSATVYGSATSPGCTEDLETGRGITNPYGQTKYVIEQLLKDVTKASSDFELSILRYFNPIGNHPSGLIGEDPATIPTNIVPVLVRVMTGMQDHLDIFGIDYATKDGTCVRDFIHVVDLARGHIQALVHSKPGVNIYNLGTGKPHSVLELVTLFESKLGRTLSKRVVPRRPGDIAIVFANATKAEQQLNWKAQFSVGDAVDSVLKYLAITQHNTSTTQGYNWLPLIFLYMFILATFLILCATHFSRSKK